MGVADHEGSQRLTWYQRQALKGLVKAARKNPGEPLGPEDWTAYFEYGAQPTNRAVKRLMRAMPSSPRCGFCAAPFGGIGGRIVGPLGYRPSRKNPNLCAVCVELAPPGGTTLEAGVLFADLRGFTTLSETLSPQEVSAVLRRFYACAENVLFPQALIDKLIGDEVMALYVPFLVARVEGQDSGPLDGDPVAVAATMLDHARELLAAVGYGTPEGPTVEMGIGLDFGELFLGNIGDGSVHDFTAVGDVVNTASRLQGHALGGEVVVSERLADLVHSPPGDPELLTAKGKAEPIAVRRIRFFEPGVAV